MDHSSIQDFFEKAQGDALLRDKVASILSSLQRVQGGPALQKPEQSVWDQLIELAEPLGFVFSPDDLEAFFDEANEKAYKAVQAGELELSDSDLEIVAGGKATPGAALLIPSAIGFLCDRTIFPCF
jgi:hypothetical protein